MGRGRRQTRRFLGQFWHGHKLGKLAHGNLSGRLRRRHRVKIDLGHVARPGPNRAPGVVRNFFQRHLAQGAGQAGHRLIARAEEVKEAQVLSAHVKEGEVQVHPEGLGIQRRKDEGKLLLLGLWQQILPLANRFLLVLLGRYLLGLSLDMWALFSADPWASELSSNIGRPSLAASTSIGLLGAGKLSATCISGQVSSRWKRDGVIGDGAGSDVDLWGEQGRGGGEGGREGR